MHSFPAGASHFLTAFLAEGLAEHTGQMWTGLRWINSSPSAAALLCAPNTATRNHFENNTNLVTPFPSANPKALPAHLQDKPNY